MVLKRIQALTLPCLFFISRLAQTNEEFQPPFALVLFMSCNLPLQGFWNWFNYKRLKIKICCCGPYTSSQENPKYSASNAVEPQAGELELVAVDDNGHRVFDWPGDRNEITDAAQCSSALILDHF